jgi:cellulose synthase/poly-beta-1,6-N-acetylglucosamine synthase-like glycosyltransferase
MQISLVVLAIIPYLGIIILFIVGWFRIPVLKQNQHTVYPLVSVIIPVKNEEKNIGKVVEDIAEQTYPSDKIEVLIVDDHSTDETVSIVKSLSLQYRFLKIFETPDLVGGKKKALWHGLQSAKGEFIITTDGDCSFPKTWILSMVKYYLAFPLHLLIGPVFFKRKAGLFHNFQELEFLSLIASGAGASGIGRPILCNGANLGAHRSLFFKGGSIYQSSVASGDDMFLLLELKRQKVKSVFVKDIGAAVETENTSGLKKFMKQRSRWTFKSRFYRDTDVILVALIVLFTNVFLVNGLFYSLVCPHFLSTILLFYISKCVVDYVLLYYVAKFFNRKNLLRYFLVHQLLYIFYVSFVGIAGHFTGEKWKNRL